MKEVAVFWFRRDLRLQDNTALYHALKSGFPVVPLFIFDRNILDDLDDQKDQRVHFIYSELEKIHIELLKWGSGLLVKSGKPKDVWKLFIKSDKISIKAVFANHDYEPYARERDETMAKLLNEENIPFFTFKDHVIFEKSEVTKDDGLPYTVFTPYSKKWKASLSKDNLLLFDCNPMRSNFFKEHDYEFPTLASIGFIAGRKSWPCSVIQKIIIDHYQEKRDYPAVNGTSRLSVHLRFGTISIRELVNEALKYKDTFLNELIWREFYMMILWHFPHVVTQSFKQKYDRIQWSNNEELFEKWSEGNTGYAFVDAGMRELNATGFMHNRLRMITAGFLTKHLFMDWRRGEAYFAKKLLDFDLAANNGGWQWAAGTGCDAAPYFRIFNPTAQMKKFDPDLKYVKQWVPEFGTSGYPAPIIDHTTARDRTLKAFKEALT